MSLNCDAKNGKLVNCHAIMTEYIIIFLNLCTCYQSDFNWNHSSSDSIIASLLYFVIYGILWIGLYFIESSAVTNSGGSGGGGGKRQLPPQTKKSFDNR